jgi:hypothetical protein
LFFLVRFVIVLRLLLCRVTLVWKSLEKFVLPFGGGGAFLSYRVRCRIAFFAAHYLLKKRYETTQDFKLGKNSCLVGQAN